MYFLHPLRFPQPHQNEYFHHHEEKSSTFPKPSSSTTCLGEGWDGGFLYFFLVKNSSDRKKKENMENHAKLFYETNRTKNENSLMQFFEKWENSAAAKMRKLFHCSSCVKIVEMRKILKWWLAEIAEERKRENCVRGSCECKKGVKIATHTHKWRVFIIKISHARVIINFCTQKMFFFLLRV